MDGVGSGGGGSVLASASSWMVREHAVPSPRQGGLRQWTMKGAEDKAGKICRCHTNLDTAVNHLLYLIILAVRPVGGAVAAVLSGGKHGNAAQPPRLFDGGRYPARFPARDGVRSGSAEEPCWSNCRQVQCHVLFLRYRRRLSPANRHGGRALRGALCPSTLNAPRDAGGGARNPARENPGCKRPPPTTPLFPFWESRAPRVARLPHSGHRIPLHRSGGGTPVRKNELVHSAERRHVVGHRPEERGAGVRDRDREWWHQQSRPPSCGPSYQDPEKEVRLGVSPTRASRCWCATLDLSESLAHS